MVRFLYHSLRAALNVVLFYLLIAYANYIEATPSVVSGTFLVLAFLMLLNPKRII